MLPYFYWEVAVVNQLTASIREKYDTPRDTFFSVWDQPG